MRRARSLALLVTLVALVPASSASARWLVALSGSRRRRARRPRPGFVEEGRIRQNAWVRGKYEDELVMSVLREEWMPRA